MLIYIYCEGLLSVWKRKSNRRTGWCMGRRPVSLRRCQGTRAYPAAERGCLGFLWRRAWGLGSIRHLHGAEASPRMASRDSSFSLHGVRLPRPHFALRWSSGFAPFAGARLGPARCKGTKASRTVWGSPLLSFPISPHTPPPRLLPTRLLFFPTAEYIVYIVVW